MLHAHRPKRKRNYAWITWTTLVGLVLAGCRDTTGPNNIRGVGTKPLAAVVPGAAVEFYIHGAAEMWQIFMGDQTVASLRAGTKVVMVHTTAGDAGKAAAFWQAREAGALASVDLVLGSDIWTCGAQIVNSHSMQRCAKGNAVVYFMRMPDGNQYDGTGYGKGSLSNLRDKSVPTATVDGLTTYNSWTDFTTTLRAVITLESAGQPVSAVAVHAPDYDRTANPKDHPDNFATADAVRPAAQGMGWTLVYYVDYDTENRAGNLSQADHDTKQNVFLAYDNVMVASGYASDAADPDIKQWLWRTYYRVSSPIPPAAPSALSANSPYKARVDLQWTDNAVNETGVWIERAPDVNGAAGAYEQIGAVGANVNAYADVAVHPATKYWYRVRAYSDGGASDYSNSASVTTPASTPLPYRADAYIVAHADDWQIFFGDHAYTSFQNAASMLFIFTTAGDAGKPQAYWMARERGALASVDNIIGAGAWSCGSQTVRNHPIYRCQKNSVAVYFMRMPDGNIDGTGFGLGTMMRLRDRAIATGPIDGSTMYNTWEDFYTTIGAIVDLELDGQGTPYVSVHAQEYDRTLNPKDHPDHTATGDAVTAAAGTHTWDLFYYVDYDTENRAVNLTDTQHTQKLNEFKAYDQTMVNAGYASLLSDKEYQAWLWRTYFRSIQGVVPPPPSPTNLAVQSVSTSELDLTWVDNSANESGFNIEQAPDNNGAAGAYSVIATVGSNVTSFANTGLNASTRYWYRVRAFNASGNSGYTNESSATTMQLPPPLAPSGLAAQAASTSEIDLTWTDNSADESGFNIERAADNNGVAGAYSVIATVGANATSFANTGLNASTRYWYRVQAFNSNGNSSYTNESSATTVAAPTTPNAPTNLALSAPSYSQVNLTWTDNSSDETGFRIERAPNVNGVAGTYTQIATVGAGVTTYSNTGLTLNTTYWYRVCAYNAVGCSTYSNQASITTPLGKPNAPTGLTVTSTTTTSIALSWTDNATDETGYRVERAPDAGGVPGTVAQITSLAANATTYTTSGLATSTTYWYRVRAAGPTNSDYSNIVSGTTKAVPNTPTGLAVTSTTSTSIKVTWTDNATDETGYRVERAPDNAGVPGTFAQIASLAANVTSYTNTGLASSTTYWYRVRAAGAAFSAYSNTVSGTTLIAPPAAPTGFVATGVAGHEIHLAWTDNSTTEESFTLQRAPDNNGVAGSYSSLATLTPNTTSYANVKVPANTRYWYRIRSNNAGGSSAWVITSVTSLAEAPLAPTAFTAKLTTSAATATLAWTDNSNDESGFRIEQAPDNGGVPGTYTQVGTVGANVKTYTASGLTGATKYWFRVASYSAYGAAYANEATMTTPLPRNLNVTKSLVSGTWRANLTWTAGVGTRVDVYRDGAKIKSNLSNTGSTTDNNRTVGATNVYQVCNVGFTGAAQCTSTFSITF